MAASIPAAAVADTDEIYQSRADCSRVDDGFEAAAAAVDSADVRAAIGSLAGRDLSGTREDAVELVTTLALLVATMLQLPLRPPLRSPGCPIQDHPDDVADSFP